LLILSSTLLILSSHSLTVQIKTYFRKGFVFSTSSPPITKPFTPSIVNCTPSHWPSTYHRRRCTIISCRGRRAIHPRRRTVVSSRRPCAIIDSLFFLLFYLFFYINNFTFHFPYFSFSYYSLVPFFSLIFFHPLIHTNLNIEFPHISYNKIKSFMA